MAKKIYASFGVDIDAVSGWLGSYGGEDSINDIQRGIYAGELGVPRLLKTFQREDIRATWFVPGHSAETFPDQLKMIVDAGHEVGAHGYSHENPKDMTAQQERDVLERSVEVLTKATGCGPARVRRTVVGDVPADRRPAAGVRLRPTTTPSPTPTSSRTTCDSARHGPTSTTPRTRRSG